MEEVPTGDMNFVVEVKEGWYEFRDDLVVTVKLVV
jgi:hypothetical protein